MTVADVVACSGGWYVTGRDGEGPAAWYSADGRTFTAVPLAPVTVYGPRHLLYSAACTGDRLAVLGAAPGGAHGKPRTSTWYLKGGTLAEKEAPVELFGGPREAGIFRITAGPGGFLVAGNHPGATAWLSADGVDFRLAPAEENRMAIDGAVLPDGWVLAGDEVWRSADGTKWTVEKAPVAVQRLAWGDGQLLAAGVIGRTFELWAASRGGAWRRLAAFGQVGGETPARVLALSTVPGGDVYLTTGSGTQLRLWRWRAGVITELVLPDPVNLRHEPGALLPLAAGPGQLAVASRDGRISFLSLASR